MIQLNDSDYGDLLSSKIIRTYGSKPIESNGRCYKLSQCSYSGALKWTYSNEAPIWATPLWLGSAGISVQVDEDATEYLKLVFDPTGSPSRDALSYYEAMTTFFSILLPNI